MLADYASDSEYHNQGERVVAGQHLMQAVSDIFLGWQSVTPPGRRSADYYLRQLRDWKYSAKGSGSSPWVLAGWLAFAAARRSTALRISAARTIDRATAVQIGHCSPRRAR